MYASAQYSGTSKYVKSKMEYTKGRLLENGKINYDFFALGLKIAIAINIL
jgi:hypothetical protein